MSEVVDLTGETNDLIFDLEVHGRPVPMPRLRHHQGGFGNPVQPQLDAFKASVASRFFPFEVNIEPNLSVVLLSKLDNSSPPFKTPEYTLK